MLIDLIKLEKELIYSGIEGCLWKVTLKYKGKQYTFDFKIEENKEINKLDCLDYLFNTLTNTSNYKKMFNRKREALKEYERDKRIFKNMKRLFGNDIEKIKFEFNNL